MKTWIRGKVAAIRKWMADVEAVINRETELDAPPAHTEEVP